mmetsp:Transcript_19753/g.61150  ORF Transcript_19753/g.61150 Transcript_19753/m.61150 type:complete len:354 (+) Transcript_19753:281-1342(+)
MMLSMVGGEQEPTVWAPSMSSLIDAAGAFLQQWPSNTATAEDYPRKEDQDVVVLVTSTQQSEEKDESPTSPVESMHLEDDVEMGGERPGMPAKGISVSCLANSEELEGHVLVLARCRSRTDPKKFRLSWRSAHFSATQGGVLRIFRSPDDRAKWADLGSSCENLAKWRSALSDAYVVTGVRDLTDGPPPPPSHVCSSPSSKKRDYCGALRAKCAALGSVVEEELDADDDDASSRGGCNRMSLSSETVFSSRSLSSSSDDDDDANAGSPFQRRNPMPPPRRPRFAAPSAYRTFEVWLKEDVTKLGARPVLKFAGNGAHDLDALRAHLFGCTRFQARPKQLGQRTRSHPLLPNTN